MYKHRHLFITLCILLLSSYSKGQIRGKLILSEDETTYEFYVTPNFDAVSPLSTTNSAQISIVAPIGGLAITNFKSIVGQWDGTNPVIDSPIENPNASYVSIPLSSILATIEYKAGEEILLFTFENAAECLGPLQIVDDESDPFLPPNSLSVNLGNQFTVLGLGPRNVYEGSDQCCVPCPGTMVEETMEETMEDEIPSDATPATSEGTLCNSNTKSNIEIRLSATGTPPYIATWENTTTGERDTMSIAEIIGTYELIEDAAPGIYEILLVDAQGRRLELVEVVEEPQYFLNPQLFITSEASCGTETGGVEVQFSDNTPMALSYIWSTGDTTARVETLAAGEYEVTITDSNGCVTTQRAIVPSSGEINAPVTQTNISCEGRNDGQLSVNLPNPAIFQFQWEGNTINSTESNLTNLAPGNYSVTISDLDGDCSEVQSFIIEEPDELAIAAQLLEEPGCSELTENTILVNAIAGSTPTLEYAIGNNDFSANNRFEVPTGQSYEITARNDNGCTSTTSILVPETSGLSVDIPERVTLELGEEMELNLSYESNNPVNIQWEDHPSLSCTDCPNPTINPTQTTTYTLILSDDNGCSKDATIIVFITKKDRIYTPTAFSPNNDGINDFFNIFTGNTVKEVNNLQIYNRWGDRVFQSTDGYTANVNEVGWNGQFKGRAAESGVYIYFAEVTLVDETVEILRGEVSLLR